MHMICKEDIGSDVRGRLSGTHTTTHIKQHTRTHATTHKNNNTLTHNNTHTTTPTHTHNNNTQTQCGQSSWLGVGLVIRGSLVRFSATPGTLVVLGQNSLFHIASVYPAAKWVPSINKAVLRVCALYAASCSGISLTQHTTTHTHNNNTHFSPLPDQSTPAILEVFQSEVVAQPLVAYAEECFNIVRRTRSRMFWTELIVAKTSVLLRFNVCGHLHKGFS